MSMKLNFEQCYVIMLDKEYLIKSQSDLDKVYKKQARIMRQTGRKPRLTVSMRNSMPEF